MKVKVIIVSVLILLTACTKEKTEKKQSQTINPINIVYQNNEPPPGNKNEEDMVAFLVTDSNNNPIENVVININSITQNFTLISNANGTAVFYLNPNNYQYSIFHNNILIQKTFNKGILPLYFNVEI